MTEQPSLIKRMWLPVASLIVALAVLAWGAFVKGELAAQITLAVLVPFVAFAFGYIRGFRTAKRQHEGAVEEPSG